MVLAVNPELTVNTGKHGSIVDASSYGKLKDERREPGYSDSDSASDEGYDDFLAFLQNPSPKKAPVVHVVKAEEVQPVKSLPVVKASKLGDADDFERKGTAVTQTASWDVYSDGSVSSSSEDSGAMMRGTSLGRGTMAFNAEDSDSDSSLDGDFMAMLAAPSPKATPKPVVAPPAPVVQKKAVAPKSASTRAVAPKAASTRATAPAPKAASTRAVPRAASTRSAAPKAQPKPASSRAVSKAAAAPVVAKAAQPKSQPKPAPKKVQAQPKPAAKPAPKAVSKKVQAQPKPAVVPAAVSAIESKQAESKPVPARAQSYKPPARPVEPKFELPKTASVATLHFENEELSKAKAIEASRSQTATKEPVAPVPIDHFTKMGDKETALKAKEQWERAEEVMPIAVKKFTLLAEEEKERHAKEMKELSNREASVATLYFNRLAEEKAAAQETAKEAEIMPAAIQHFTMAAYAENDRKRAAVEEMKANPPEMPAGQEYFTSRDRAEKEKKAAEIEAMKENPPPASVATEYFNKRESRRKLEVEAMANEPAPAAIEYFTRKAEEEERQAKETLRRIEEKAPEASVATAYFARQESMKAEAMEAARAETRAKEPVEPLPVDHFTKLGEAQMEEKKREQWERAEEVMPIAVKKFTLLAEEEKANKAREMRELSEREASVATLYFNRLAEKEAEERRAQSAEAEIMPAAIQHFTVADRERKERQRAINEGMKENPPPMAPGQEYFTSRDRAQKEKQRQENEAMKENPPPASVATEYFNKMESQRKLDVERELAEPAPPAIEYFTRKADEERERQRAINEGMKENPPEASAATQHFARQESVRAERLEASRAEAREKLAKGTSQRSQVDWAALTGQTAPKVPAY